MPRSGDEYSLPPGTVAVAGALAHSAHVNSRFADLEAEQNLSRPVTKGGTGATSAPAALVNLGLTAVAAELNVLDGIPGTLTATEVGYLDGVTSAIQTQIDAKQASDSDLTAIAGLTRTRGDLIVGGASAWIDLALGSVGRVAKSDGTDVVWGSPENPQTVQAASSGASVDFTGIPSWVNEITLSFFAVSLTGTDDIDVRPGNSGGFISTGYQSPRGIAITGGVVSEAVGTTGVPIAGNSAGTGFTGNVLIKRLGLSSTIWIVSYTGTRGTNVVQHGGGGLDVTSDLTQVRVRPFGANSFDGSGFIGISWK